MKFLTWLVSIIPSWAKVDIPCLVCDWLYQFECVSRFKSRWTWVMRYSQTTATRFWFGLCSLGFASFIYFSPTVHTSLSEYVLMMKLAPAYLWSSFFFIHWFALWYGVFTRTYNKILLVLEGILGIVIWSAASLCVGIAQGAPGATSAGMLLAYWLLVRYPTHWEYDSAI